jgi:hypothetical protein
MDRSNWPPYNNINYNYYNQIHQEETRYTSQQETGQTSAGGGTSGASGQPYLNPGLPASIPSSSGLDLEYLLRTPQPIYNTDYYYGQMHQEGAQYASQPETGQTSAGGASGLPYLNPNLPAPIPSSPGLELEYLLRTPQPTAVEEAIQNDVSPEQANPQPTAAPHRKARVNQLLPLKERFLAALDNYAQGVPLVNCASTFEFRSYIADDGHLHKRGQELYDGLSPNDQERVNKAILSRCQIIYERLADKDTATERFLAGLDNYAQGLPLKDCSTTLQYRYYVSNDGYLQKPGRGVYKSLSPEDQERVNQALDSRKRAYRKQLTSAARFLAGLDKYAEGAPLKGCSATLHFRLFATDNGQLQQPGRALYESLSPEDQERVDRALISRRQIYCEQLPTNNTVQKRFLEALNDYARGVPMIRCSDINFNLYVTDDGQLQPKRGLSIYRKLGPDDKERVDQALTARARIFTQGAAKDVDKFMAALKPYANGQTLEACGIQSGLKRKASMYLTSEGGLTSKGNRLIENLQPDQCNEVWNAIRERQRRTESNPSVSESSWQGLEMPSSMPEMPGINQTAMADPTQTDAMWATVWQLTGQPVQGGWEIASEPVEPHIDSFGIDAVGADFRHRYGPNGLLPQRAPDRLISLGIWHHRLINILGETYRVQSLAGGVAPSNENPYGQSFMLVPHMRGG